MSDELAAKIDTEVALKRGRAALEAIAEHWELEHPTDEQVESYFDAVFSLWDAFVSLDIVLTRGGPLPAEWSPNPDIENLERRSRYALKARADGAIEQGRIWGTS
jgi:hypothetical protein